MKTIKQLLITIAVLLCSATTYAYDFEVDGIYYTFITESTCAVTYGETKYSGAIIIPKTVIYDNNSLRVIQIYDNAFYYCSNLTSITIPNSITNIGSSAFSHCSNLTSITIPNSITNIGNSAFSHCSNLTSITIPESVTTIGAWAFEFCSNLKSVKIQGPVTDIHRQTFYACTKLTTVLLPKTIINIGDSAFSNCTELTSITIHNSVTNIGAGAFYACKSLTSITIPNSVTNIGASAFQNCEALKSITIPQSVTSIENNTFSNCIRLKSITIPNNITNIGNNAFNKCFSLANIYCYNTTPANIGTDILYDIWPTPYIHVPDVSVDKYKSKWSSYSSNILGMPTYTSNGWTSEPSVTDDVAINHPLIIEENVLNEFNSLGISNDGSLTIKEGGQLVANYICGNITVEKEIIGHQQNTDNNQQTLWYTISSPLKYSMFLENAENHSNILNGDYELYRYDESYHTWQNYKNHINNGFTTLDCGIGYLYANKDNITLSFTGSVNTDNVVCNLTNNSDILKGFHLIGNPFTHNISADNFNLYGATLASGYYVLSNEGEWNVHLTNSGFIKPAQGALIKATTTAFAPTLIISNNNTKSNLARNNKKKSFIEIAVSNEKYSDKVYALFEKGIGLDKINHQNENIPLLYIPDGDIDYAVAIVDKNFIEIPLGFEASVMGEYTISVNIENCDFTDLYLIDKQTEKKVNILKEDYTFMATSNDNSDRFLLCLDNQTSDASNFAHINNSELIINGISGDTQIYIYDMLGHCVYSNTNSNENNSININRFESGTYIIQKIDNREINCQKIVL
ncbi:MAG: leucine-rich repeat domain-containing protein [Lentimicrobiaceae bacterium]|nr:leucine-rich repeat domain-containing protein [Lentimicrobiaceae bacterium]